MIFLDPKTDITIKKLDTNDHKNIIITFLNIILNRKKNETISDIITINCDPQDFPEPLALIPKIVYIEFIDQAKRHFAVETQVITQRSRQYPDPYYEALALCHPLKSGRLHRKLVPELFVGDLDFKFYKNHDLQNAFHILKNSTRSYQDFDLHYRFLDIMHTQIARYEYAFEKGMAIKKAKSKVIAEDEWKIDIAEQCLDVFDIEKIAEMTDLDIEVIKQLKIDIRNCF